MSTLSWSCLKTKCFLASLWASWITWVTYLLNIELQYGRYYQMILARLILGQSLVVIGLRSTSFPDLSISPTEKSSLHLFPRPSHSSPPPPLPCQGSEAARASDGWCHLAAPFSQTPMSVNYCSTAPSWLGWCKMQFFHFLTWIFKGNTISNVYSLVTLLPYIVHSLISVRQSTM